MKTQTAIISIAELSSDGLPILNKTFQSVLGVESVEYNIKRSVAVIEFDPSKTKVDELLRAVVMAGYKII